MSEKTTQQQNKKKRTIIISAIVALGCAAAFFIPFYILTRPSPDSDKKAIIIDVIDNNGSKKTYPMETSAEYLQGAMDELQADNTTFSYSYTDTMYGAYLDTINGITASYSNNGAYWCVYDNGNVATTTVTSVTLINNGTYALKYVDNSIQP